MREEQVYEREGLGARLSLANATYYVQQSELAYAFEKGRA